MTTDIFSSFLRSLDASMGAQNRNILLFVDNCAAHPKYTSCLRNVKVIQYLAKLQPLDLGVIKCYKQLYRKRIVQTAVCLMDAGKDTEKKINVFEALHYTVAALQQVTQQTIENCFRKAGYVQGQSSGDSDVVLTNDDDFRQDWEKFSGMNKDKFEDCVSVDSHVTTCGVQTVQELCVSPVASGSVEMGGGGQEDGEPEVVLNFAETHEALMKVKAFFYAHSTSDSDRESVLGLEKSYFELRSKVCTKQTSVKDFFQVEVIIIIKLFLSIIFNGFPVLLFTRMYRFCFPSP
jgi:hypothetical protein